MKQKAYNYGECHVCGGKVREQLVKQEFWLKDQLVIVDDLPAGVCEQCGEKVVNAEVSQHVDSLLRNERQFEKAPVLLVPVIRFTK
jgi:YgiT-type zinc finger domain-containing protein